MTVNTTIAKIAALAANTAFAISDRLLAFTLYLDGLEKRFIYREKVAIITDIEARLDMLEARLNAL